MNPLSSVEYLIGPIGNSAINVFWNSSLLFLREKQLKYRCYYRVSTSSIEKNSPENTSYHNCQHALEFYDGEA